MLKKIFNFLGYTFSKTHKSTNENEIIDFQIRQVNPDIIIDCGGNHGDFYQMVKKHKKKVILFEPNPFLKNKLSRLADNDKNLIFIPKGTDKSSRIKKIYLTNDKRQTLSSIKKQNLNIKKNFKKTDVITTQNIKLTTLNSALSKLKIPFTKKIFLKLDTQGNDYETLIGLKKRIKQISLIRIEMPVLPLYEKVKTHWDILFFLKKNAFQPIHFINGPRDQKGRIIEYDVFFLRKK